MTGRKSISILSAIALLFLLSGAVALAMKTEATALTKRAPLARLTGDWKRIVSEADIKRAGATAVPDNARCHLSISQSGEAAVSCTTIGSFAGTIVSVSADQVDIHLGAPPNTYTWSVDQDKLRFAHWNDPVPNRRAVFDGVWTRL